MSQLRGGKIHNYQHRLGVFKRSFHWVSPLEEYWQVCVRPCVRACMHACLCMHIHTPYSLSPSGMNQITSVQCAELGLIFAWEPPDTQVQ